MIYMLPRNGQVSRSMLSRGHSNATNRDPIHDAGRPNQLSMGTKQALLRSIMSLQVGQFTHCNVPLTVLVHARWRLRFCDVNGQADRPFFLSRPSASRNISSPPQSGRWSRVLRVQEEPQRDHASVSHILIGLCWHRIFARRSPGVRFQHIPSSHRK